MNRIQREVFLREGVEILMESMKKSTSIMFATEMVQAYIAGKKTMTRRASGLDVINENPDDWRLLNTTRPNGRDIYHFGHVEGIVGVIQDIICPKGGVGDEIYCKETWKLAGYSYQRDVDILYKADNAVIRLPLWNDWLEKNTKYGASCEVENRWRSSMFMPRWASRFAMPLTGLRCERVQSIAEADAIAEGFKSKEDFLDYIYKKNPKKKGKNFWCWVLEFPRYEANK